MEPARNKSSEASGGRYDPSMKRLPLHHVFAACSTAVLASAVAFACGSEGSPPACSGAACDDAGREGSLPAEGGVDATSERDAALDAGDTGDASGEGSTCPGPAGTLDPTFGDGGIVWLKLASSGADAIAVQTDGKVVLGGYRTGETKAILLRLLADGALDPSFGSGGVAESYSGTAGTSVKAVAVQTDGRIIAAGSSRSTGSPNQITIARHLVNGAPDPSFGNSGVLVVDYPGRDAYAHALAVRPDGKIVVAGYSEDAVAPTASANFEIARYGADGMPDPTFGGTGRIMLDIRGTDDRVGALALGQAGATIIAGSSKETAALTGRYDIAAARLKDDGSLDPTFANAGKFVSAFGTGSQRGSGVVVAPTGAVIIGGWSGGAAPDDFAVLRLTAAGALDPGFGDGGAVKTDFGGRGDRSVRVLLQDDGRVVALGMSGSGAQSDTYGISVARLLATGTVDPSFGGGGLTFVAPPPNSQLGASAGVLTNCSVLATGTWLYDLNAVSDSAIGVVRLRR
jgi:uncharacterized delta-60 repeat protein